MPVGGVGDTVDGFRRRERRPLGRWTTRRTAIRRATFPPQLDGLPGPLTDIGPPDGPLDVVVWEADGTLDGQRGYGQPIATGLRRAGLRVSTVPLDRRRPVGDELTAPAHVISGGSTAVAADDRWLRATRRRLRPLLDRAGAGETSVVGICFGAQLLAHLLAGPAAVRPHPGGMQAGLVEVACGDGSTGSTDPRGGPVRQVVSSFHHHRVEPAALERAGAEILLSSSATPVQAFRVGGNVTGLQFHPELTPGMLRLTLRTHRTLVDATGTGWRRADRSIDARSHRWSGTLWNALVLGTLARALSPAAPGDAPAPARAPAPGAAPALLRVPA